MRNSRNILVFEHMKYSSLHFLFFQTKNSKNMSTIAGAHYAGPAALRRAVRPASHIGTRPDGRRVSGVARIVECHANCAARRRDLRVRQRGHRRKQAVVQNCCLKIFLAK